MLKSNKKTCEITQEKVPEELREWHINDLKGKLSIRGH